MNLIRKANWAAESVFEFLFQIKDAFCSHPRDIFTLYLYLYYLTLKDKQSNTEIYDIFSCKKINYLPRLCEKDAARNVND